MTTHILNVSRAGVIRTLRDQFTNSTTFLSEALQNARRAGASRVLIEWNAEAGVMAISDDGSGIADFAAVFTIGQSGWDAQVIAQENPFGVGLMAAVLASRHVTIHSLGEQVCFNSDELLAFTPVTVVPAPPRRGTQLRLTLRPEYQRSTETWLAVLGAMVCGFPLPVYFNAEPLARPHALDGALEFLDTDIGRLHLKGWRECEPASLRQLPILYWQGLPIRPHRGRHGQSEDVLHLDAHRFRARVPDRDVLIDAADQERVIDETVHALWRQRLFDQKARLSPLAFADRHWRLCVELKLPELLADSPLAASMLWECVQPVSAVSLDDTHLSPWSDRPLPTREAVFVDDLSGGYCGSDGDVAAPLASIYAMKRGLPVLDQHVRGCHWARARTVDLLDSDLGLRYELHGRTRKMRFAGAWVWCDVCVCESYTIRFQLAEHCAVPAELHAALTPVTVTDRAFFDAVEQCLIVPDGEPSPGEAVSQISTYCDDMDRFRDAEYERDQECLARLVASLRADSPAAYLTALLREVWADPSLVGDTVYRLRYDKERHGLVVEGA